MAVLREIEQKKGATYFNASTTKMWTTLPGAAGVASPLPEMLLSPSSIRLSLSLDVLSPTPVL